MAAKKATDDVVFPAADALAAEGKSPSPTSIRERLGFGSYTTIQEALVRWEQAVALRNAYPLPDEIATQADSFLRCLWTAAREQAELATAGIRQAADLKVHRATAELVEAQAEINRLEQQLADTTERGSEVEAAFARVRESAIAQDARIEHLQTSLEHASREAARVGQEKDDQALAQAGLRARCELLEHQHTHLLAILEKLGLPSAAADTA
jgi:chromosome segregation ATPase